MATRKKQLHWTAKLQSFQNHITDEYLTMLEDRLEEKGMNRRQFAKLIGVSEGRVSQIFKNPGNLTISKMVEWSRKLGLKFAILTYDDGDPDNVLGPVFADVFKDIWEILEKPRDYDDLERVRQNCGQCSKRGVIKEVQQYNSILPTSEKPPAEWNSSEGLDAYTESSAKDKTPQQTVQIVNYPSMLAATL